MENPDGLRAGDMNSLPSEVAALRHAGIRPADIQITEDDMTRPDRRARYGGTMPEIVYRDRELDQNVSVEVKRINQVGPAFRRTGHVSPTQVRRIRSRLGRPRVAWHWAPLVMDGINKITDEFLSFVESEFGVSVRAHWLLLAVPETMGVADRRSILRHAETVLASMDTRVRTYIDVVPVPVECF